MPPRRAETLTPAEARERYGAQAPLELYAQLKMAREARARRLGRPPAPGP